MKEKSLSNWIALNFMMATAIMIAVIFSSIYFVVYRTVYTHLNNDLEAEYEEISGGIVFVDGEIIVANRAEWSEAEHAQIEVNPTFIQLSDTTGNVLKRSPNLKGTSLKLLKNKNGEVFFNSSLSGDQVRQLQVVLVDDTNRKAGFISIAIPLDESQVVLKNLLATLLATFPFVLLVLYMTTKYITQKSILPIKKLTDSAAKITRENLNERIELPVRHDELYSLTGSINSLLNRIEDTLQREKQFSSDASHELRTPLSVLKGTLELMLRKPRDVEYFQQKANTCLEEVNRMTGLVDQLLLLARYGNLNDKIEFRPVNLHSLVQGVVARHAVSIEKKGISLFLNIDEQLNVVSDPFMLEQIVENIFSNALKYSFTNSTIGIISAKRDDKTILTIKDEGIGMSPIQVQQIFNRFYRADESRAAQIKGYGLGLAIAKRFSDLLQISIQVESQINSGSSFTIVFPSPTVL